MQKLEKRYWSRDAHVIDIHRGRKSVRISTVDNVTLKEVVFYGNLDASSTELVNALYEKMDSIKGSAFTIEKG